MKSSIVWWRLQYRRVTKSVVVTLDTSSYRTKLATEILLSASDKCLIIWVKINNRKLNFPINEISCQENIERLTTRERGRPAWLVVTIRASL